MIVEKNSFVSRLKEALGTSEPAEAARLLGISYQGAKNYLEGRIPTTEILLNLSASTGVSIHWLLTGEGDKHPGQESSTLVESLFDEKHRQIIQDIADAGGLSFSETILHLVREALAVKGLGEYPEMLPIPVFQMMPEDLEQQVFRHLDSLPEPTRTVETKRLIGALVTRAAAP